MRNRFKRIKCIFFLLGYLLQTFTVILLIPIIMVIIYWGQRGDGWETLAAFFIPAFLSASLGIVLNKTLKSDKSISMAGSMLICSLGWILVSALGAVPFVIGINSSYINAYFEAMSGFTTTGITVYSGLDYMPRSILFWRSLTQWFGGVGILSFFLMITFRGGGAHHIFGAESHKISSSRPVPGLFNTLKILWGIYGLFTLFGITVLVIEGMSLFDSICHTFTALSSGGFSPYDSSIAYYDQSGHANFRLIEYTIIFLMLLAGINFLIHYRILTRDFKALWDNIEIRYWWGFISIFTLIIFLEHFIKTGFFTELVNNPMSIKLSEIEKAFRHTLFQVVSIMTTTGFGTRDIGDSFFPALSKQLFLIMMVIGGCVGSTGGGIKVLRVAILNRLMYREIRNLRVPERASKDLVVDNHIVPDEETHRVGALFFTWMALLLIGGGITALLSNHSPWASFSGMFSALGNIGPCYISVQDMININPFVKIIYIFGMLAGRLEILPVFLLFSRKAWT
ncbi:TrkH family potassium uptake protein [Candidatus Poribacteria bacterium]|nr:TrkH family potassium uptake protein [Candidatus Poribacteria bacterium]